MLSSENPHYRALQVVLFIVVGLTIPINYTTATELIVGRLIVRRIPLEGIEQIYPIGPSGQPAGSLIGSRSSTETDRSRMTL